MLATVYKCGFGKRFVPATVNFYLPRSAPAKCEDCAEGTVNFYHDASTQCVKGEGMSNGEGKIAS
jgi:hypothetical protein